MRNLAQLPPGSRVFVDASILALYFTDHEHLADPCEAFLLRSASKEVVAFTSAVAAAEVIHRVIVHEAQEHLKLPTSRETVEYLQQHPEVIKGLHKHLTVASEIHHMGVDILPVSYRELHESKWVRREHGLMTNDSLIVATMRRNGIHHLATHDAGFQRVPGIRVWGPAPH